MKIQRILAWKVDLPLCEGSYKWSGGKSVTVFDSTVVGVQTDSGHWGYGEVCPAGAVLPGRLRQRRAGGHRRTRPAPAGRGPAPARRTQPPHGCRAEGPSLRQVGHRHRLLGHPGTGRRAAGMHPAWAAATAKTLACIGPSRRNRPRPWPLAWPAIGPKATAASSSRWAAIPTSISRGSARSRRKLQPGDRLVADANTGWLMHEAMRVVRAVRDVDVYIEQPCLSYEECLSIRRHTDHPFVLDEVIDGVDDAHCAARPTWRWTW